MSPVLVLLLLTACGDDNPVVVQPETLICTLEVVAPDGSSQANWASIVSLPGEEATLSVPPWKVNILVFEIPDSQQLALRVIVFGPDGSSTYHRAEIFPVSPAPGNSQGIGSGREPNGDYFSMECMTAWPLHATGNLNATVAPRDP
jgi:hypothetical protein